MEKILKKVAGYVRKNATEGAGAPSTRTLMERNVPEVLRAARETKEDKK